MRPVAIEPACIIPHTIEHYRGRFGYLIRNKPAAAERIYKKNQWPLKMKTNRGRQKKIKLAILL